MLHAAAMSEIEETEGAREDTNLVNAFKYPLIDPSSFDEKTLEAVRDSRCKTELVFQWVQQLVVDNIRSNVLSIPPPVLTRCFQELSNGMVAFHCAIKIASVPFPFPYAQTCNLLLVIHWVLTPVVASNWSSSWYSALIFSFVQVFVLWNLNFIAVELENPFGQDDNDIDARAMQNELNEHLKMLVSVEAVRLPTLSRWHLDPLRTSEVTGEAQTPEEVRAASAEMPECSFLEAWHSLDASTGVQRRFSGALQNLPADGPLELVREERSSKRFSPRPSFGSRSGMGTPQTSRRPSKTESEVAARPCEDVFDEGHQVQIFPNAEARPSGRPRQIEEDARGDPRRPGLGGRGAPAAMYGGAPPDPAKPWQRHAPQRRAAGLETAALHAAGANAQRGTPWDAAAAGPTASEALATSLAECWCTPHNNGTPAVPTCGPGSGLGVAAFRG